MNYLLRGRFSEGFVEYEWRWRSSELPSRPPMPTPWKGEDPRGKRLLVHAEQGLGDTLHFCRYLPLLRERGAKVVLHVQKTLRSLIAEAMPWLELIAEGENLPATDMQCSLLSLPHLLGTTLDTIPATIPYLHAKEEAAARFAATMGQGQGLKVGIVWAGSTKHLNDVDRTIALSMLSPLFAVKGVRFFSLQIGARPGDRLPAPVTDLAPELTDFAANRRRRRGARSRDHGRHRGRASCRAPWASRSGSCWPSFPIGDGSWSARTAPGIRPRDCSGKKRAAIGNM